MAYYDRVNAFSNAAEVSLPHLQPEHARYFVMLAFVLTPLIGVADFFSGTELTFILVYLVPILVATWFSSSRLLALGMIALVTLVWGTVDYLSDPTALDPVILVWDGLTRVGIYAFFAYLLFVLKSMLQRERILSRHDPLTFAYNLRAFREITDHELARCRRYAYPLTLGFIDIDDFAKINDKRGHTASNALLVKISRLIRASLRESDVLARVGEHEFAVLLVGCNQRAAKDIFKKIQTSMLGMVHEKETITLSIGATTCIDTRIDPDALMKACDTLMHCARQTGKNHVVIEKL